MTKSLGNYSGVKSSNVVNLSAWLGLCSQLNFHFCLFVLAVWSHCLTTRTQTQGQRRLSEARDAGDQWTDASILFYSYSLSRSLSDSAASGSAGFSPLIHSLALFLNNLSFLLHRLHFLLIYNAPSWGVHLLSQNEALANLFCLVIQIQWFLCTFGITVSGSGGSTFHLTCLFWV